MLRRRLRPRPMRLDALLLCAGLLLATAGAAADSNAPFLWEVKGAQATHYLLGSVHLLPESADTLPDGIADAYDAVDDLVFESDIAALNSPKAGLSLVSAAKAPHGMKAEVDAATYARLRSRMAALKVPSALCEQYKPWFCALTLEVFAYQRAGFSGEHGLDRQLYEIGKSDGKRISWFETPAAHLGLFTTMDEALGKQLLSAALAEDGSSGDDPAELFRAWRDNDTGRIEGLIAEMKTRYPLVHARLLADRNRAWAAKLHKLLDGTAPTLVVVGAAHWLGPDGLLAELRAAGYKPHPYVVRNPDQITAMPDRPPMITATALAGSASHTR